MNGNGEEQFHGFLLSGQEEIFLRLPGEAIQKRPNEAIIKTLGYRSLLQNGQILSAEKIRELLFHFE